MYRSSWLFLGLFICAAWAIGPVAQYTDYHHFADQNTWLGSLNGKDVWSNLGFVAVGWWGMWQLQQRQSRHFVAWASFVAMALTGFGSAYYHVIPNDLSLIWDRLPISLTCAGLLACVWAYVQNSTGRLCYVIAAIIAIAGVWLWQQTGDLRGYLALQLWTIVLTPWWLKHAQAPKALQAALWSAIAAYVLAKMAESLDTAIWMLSQQSLSGHTLKHLLATIAMLYMGKAILNMLPNANGDRLTNQKSDSLVCSAPHVQPPPSLGDQTDV